MCEKLSVESLPNSGGNDRGNERYTGKPASMSRGLDDMTVQSFPVGECDNLSFACRVDSEQGPKSCCQHLRGKPGRPTECAKSKRPWQPRSEDRLWPVANPTSPHLGNLGPLTNGKLQLTDRPNARAPAMPVL